MNLPRGRDAAITIGAISERLGLPRRAVEQAIETMRREGVPVCSGSAGVWISSSPEETLEMAERLRSRALRQMETASILKEAAERLVGAGVEALTLWDAA